MEDLTPRQRDIIEYIVTYTFRHLYQPTMREIGDNFKIRSTNGVADHLKCLQRKGYVKLGDPPQARALHLTDKALALVNPEDVLLRVLPVKGNSSCPTS